VSDHLSAAFSQREMLDHAWRYFELHANQRMSLFNFFLVLSSFVAAGLGASLQLRGAFELLGSVLGLLLAVVSFTFWKLDQRSSFLIRHAERAMAEIENAFSISAPRLFSSEVHLTAKAASYRYHPRRLWTYGAAFRFVFAVMGLVGIVGAILSVYFYFHGSGLPVDV
jgi:hypothetical protein